MAHAALFDDHPIGHYLRESGEVPELMPGGLNEFAREPTHDNSKVPGDPSATRLQTWLPRLFDIIRHVFKPILTGFRGSSASSQFAERFKYIVISSALLSSSLSSPSPNRASTPTTPGHFDQGNPILSPKPPAIIPLASGPGPHIPTYTLACLVPWALIRGYYLSCILLLSATKFISDGGLLNFLTSLGFNNGDEPWALTLDCLEALVTANNTWENVVSETLGIIDAEEQSASPPFPPSPSLPSLRTALSSSLHTTESQCDNVRQLLAALTSPLLLSQLSHMYAPPSPSLVSPSPRRSRPMSLAPPSPRRTTSQVRPLSLFNPPDDTYTRSRVGLSARTSLLDKRSTWSGSNVSLIHRSSRRQQGRRLSRSAVFRAKDLESPNTPIFPASTSASHGSTPPSAFSTMEDIGGDADAEDEPFGVAALDLHRRRRSTRSPLLSLPSSPSNIANIFSHDAPSQFDASRRPPPLTSSLGSNFTSLSSASSPLRQAQHHHISLSNLYLALQGAVGSKRFACAHLLALRFSDFNSPKSRNYACSEVDDEDGSYWEDVRSVISLLTSTLEGASARLADALADTVRMQEQEAEIIITDEDSYSNSASSRGSALLPSFAPMPSHLARFMAHIDTISSALDDARDHLQQCVASIKEDRQVTQSVPDDPESPLALQSYERLRRELGLALRECERGRGTLLEIVKPNTPDHLPEKHEGDEQAPIRHEEQLSSGESDKTLYNSSEVNEVKYSYDLGQGQDHDPFTHDDDATSHLILTATPQHLPPPGIEQVFESVSAGQPFVRERSKLTREERILMAKARRESQSSALPSGPGSREGELHPNRERWGLGGEVVQELKDVIWQVSERRRKMVERSNSLAPQSDALHSPL